MPLDKARVTSLPILSLAKAQGGPEERAQFLKDLRYTARNIGFFYLKDHGVEQPFVDELFGLSRRLFDLPDAEKLKIEMVNSPQFRGYTRIGLELTRGKADWREQIDVGSERDVVAEVPADQPWLRLQGPNQWPEALPELKDPVLRFQAEATRITVQLLQLFAEALGERPDFFEPIYSGQPDQLVKLIRYPGRDVAETDQGVGAHKDSGLLTLVVQHERSGLQVEGPDGWIDAPPTPGTFVVNIGELLEIATNGYLRATMHRVVAPPAGTDRLSIAFFLGARLDARVPLLHLPPDLAAEAKGVEQDPNNPLLDHVGLNRLKGRLRSHTDVARRHHADLVEKLGVVLGHGGTYG